MNNKQNDSFRKLNSEMTIPDRKTCLSLLQRYGTPPHVVNHCLAVADTACRIASALNQNGCDLDLALLEGAALLHDIARVEENHGQRGAEIAENLGYREMASLIYCHMFYSTDPTQERIGEQDILCLADRMVKEDLYVGIDERMRYILSKFKDNPEAVERITQRLEENKKLMERIERTIGRSIDALMTDYRRNE